MGEWLKLEEMIVNRRQELTASAERERLTRVAGRGSRATRSDRGIDQTPRQQLVGILHVIRMVQKRAFGH